MYGRTKLKKVVKKEKITVESHLQLMNYLNMAPVHDPQFPNHLKEVLTGWYTVGYPTLLSHKSVMTKCWFINKGYILAFYYDANVEARVYAIFSAGQVAILDESFHHHVPSYCWFIAYPDTHYLEVTAEQMRVIYKLFPATAELARVILTHQNKTKELLNFACLKNKEKIKLFFKLYPDVRRPNKALSIRAQHIASYLCMSKYNFSRLLKEIDKEAISASP